MAANHNSQGPEGNYDPAGSTQMFRAFVDEAAPARQAGPGARQQRRAAQQSDSKKGLWIGVAVGVVVALGAVLWVVLR
ncbi:hypothetical protein AB0P12_15700 [Streptomyces subrutilus]|uniref:Uncharacterized protein n=1 Tax=Streptomyces subrutilus TaxID=36818 RepID=A0A5P2UKS4_9ACTN|nr:hypothetical protein [Streptomyces subrutilus]QEU79916.1 hypothetical protein CP968_17685 [Streptomyces subrutilus]WSJ30824.1 hypothetical protein OG479_16935 [Streptomyces subrutilus]GGZ90831.1 hypothetical protein GCM10010371_58340 [Streptomyces subrutilus]